MTFRKLIIGLSMILLLANCSTMKVNILGIDANQAVTDMKTKDTVEMVAGVIASFATHVAGHYIAAELVGGDLEQQGIDEVITNYQDLNNSDRAMLGRGGFLLQALVNTTLTSFEATRTTYFTRGYTLGTLTEILIYPLTSPPSSGSGDLWLIDKKDNVELEWALFTAIGGYNFYRINKEKY